MSNPTNQIPPSFINDYMEGAHPLILQRLLETNMEKTTGYGLDKYCESAKAKIREVCNCSQAEIYFVGGGTQANATVIDTLLRSYQGVISATSGHINVHEAGAIEFCGHKILTLPHDHGKLKAADIEEYLRDYHADPSKDHVVMPGMVFISHPTEYGTLYTKKEIESISGICREYNIPLYLDGARLGYGLVADDTDVTLEVLTQNCTAFYIGGTKVGAFLGEAVVFTKPNLVPHFYSIIKQHGALVAKGRLLGIQFETLFTDELYFQIAKHAVNMAKKMKNGFLQKGYRLYFDSPTNQLFVILENEQMNRLAEKIGFRFWEKYDEAHSVVRLVTSWATQEKDVQKLIELL